MFVHRTTQQHEADEIDLAIYRALSRIEAQLPERGRGRGYEGWQRAAQALRAARREIREYMHPKDRVLSEEPLG